MFTQERATIVDLQIYFSSYEYSWKKAGYVIGQSALLQAH